MRLNDRVSLVASGGLSLSMTHASDCNAYLIDCGQESILIDTGTGLSKEKVIAEIDKELKNMLTYILVTHHHSDHIGGLEELRIHYNAKVIVPEAEKDSIENGDEEANGLKIAKEAGYYPVDFRLKKCVPDKTVKVGDELKFGESIVKVYDASGHSKGGVCYYFPKEKMIFAGDLLMHGGRINLQNIPGANIEKYTNSVLALETLDVEQFYPGHGCFSLNEGKIHIDKAISAFKSLGIPQNFI